MTDSRITRTALLLLLIAISTLAGCTQPTTPGEVTSLMLADEGKPTSAIVLRDKPTRAAQFAAYELQWHLFQTTGAEVPIVNDAAKVKPGHVRLIVGHGPAAAAEGVRAEDFGKQEFAVVVRPDAIVMAGHDADEPGEVVYRMDNLPACKGWPGFWEDQGTLHAVYDMLEQYVGVRWLNPTDTGTVIPTRPTLVVGARPIRRKPTFEYRDALGASGDNLSMYDYVVGLWPRGSKQLNEYVDVAYADLKKAYPDKFAQAHNARVKLFALRMRNGGQIARCNHSLYGYYDRFWAKNPNNPKLFVERRPEYFAKGYEGKPPQLCYTNRKLIEQVAQDARDYYDRKSTGAEQGIFWRPALPNPFPVEPNDNRSFCKCQQCKKLLKPKEQKTNIYSSGMHSDYFFNFVNEVAKELHKTHPDKPLVTLAYASHAYLPKTVELDPKVAVQFCFAANRAPHSRAGYEHEMDLVKQWANDGTGRTMHLWLYYTFPRERALNGKYFTFPGFFAHTVDEQMKTFKKHGYRGMFHCGYGQEVEAYVTWKLMDDADRDVDELIDEYFTGLYGHAAEPMKAMYLDIERVFSDPSLRPKERTSGSELAWGYLGTASRMKRYRELFERAMALARTERTKRNLRNFHLGTLSYMEAGRKQYTDRMKAPIPTVSAPRVAAAGGNPDKVDWTRAAPMGDKWFDRGTGRPSKRRFGGRAAHDGTYLYLELTDHVDPKKLEASATVFPYDDWELFIAAQRGMPYRQYAVGPTGLITCLSHGEINFRRNMPIEDHGIKVTNDTSGDRWTTRVAIPLAESIPGGVKPGGKVYLNVIRVSGPKIAGERVGIDTWVSYCTVHEVDRLAEIVLEK